VRNAEHDESFNPSDTSNDAMALDGDEDVSNPSTGGRSCVNVKELGGYIVNSVTLHRSPSSTSDDDVLAVLTYVIYLFTASNFNICFRNNDKTVRIFHLAENRVVTTLHVDVSTNHASISPDGQHLVVVGDSSEVYFYHPASSGSCGRSPGTGIGEAGCGSWILSSHPPLRAGTDTDALMSTSFSSSSLHCAVASQAGIITIFDTRYLFCDDGCSPLVKVITSSRAFTEPGAVRSVQFSPAPWDLLVWAEHCGKVCIADARSNFTRRQVVDVLAEKDDLVEAEVEEIQDSPSAWDISQSLLGNPISNRRYSREDDENGEDVTVSDAERSASINELADLVYENSSEWLAARVRSLTPSTYFPSHPELMSDSHSQILRSTGSGLPGSTPSLLRDYRERQIERERARPRVHDPPRRRNSIHPSYADHWTSTSSNSSTATGPTSAAATAPSERERSRLSRGSTVVPSLRPLEQITNLIADQRRRQRRGGRVDMPFVYSYASDGVDITGCTLDPDGRKL